jgi:hypothetical protein
MKNKYLYLQIAVLLFAGCKQYPLIDDHRENEIQANVFPNYETNDTVLINFIKDYLALPETKYLNIYTLLFDQRMDTLLFTISTCPFRFPDNVFYFGAIKYNNKIVLMCSPFDIIIKAKVDRNFIKQIKQLNDKDMLLFNKKGEYTSIRWQLQKPYHGRTYHIEKDQYKVWNTIIPPPPPLVK